KGSSDITANRINDKERNDGQDALAILDKENNLESTPLNQIKNTIDNFEATVSVTVDKESDNQTAGAIVKNDSHLELAPIYSLSKTNYNNKNNIEESLSVPLKITQGFLSNVIASVTNFVKPNENKNITIESKITMSNIGGARSFNEKRMTLRISNSDQDQSEGTDHPDVISIKVKCSKQQEDLLNQFEQVNQKYLDTKDNELCLETSEIICLGSILCPEASNTTEDKCLASNNGQLEKFNGSNDEQGSLKSLEPSLTTFEQIETSPPERFIPSDKYERFYANEKGELSPIKEPLTLKMDPFGNAALINKYLGRNQFNDGSVMNGDHQEPVLKLTNGSDGNINGDHLEDNTSGENNLGDNIELEDIQIENEEFDGFINVDIDEYLPEEVNHTGQYGQQTKSPCTPYVDASYQIDTSLNFVQGTANQLQSTTNFTPTRQEYSFPTDTPRQGYFPNGNQDHFPTNNSRKEYFPSGNLSGKGNFPADPSLNARKGNILNGRSGKPAKGGYLPTDPTINPSGKDYFLVNTPSRDTTETSDQYDLNCDQLHTTNYRQARVHVGKPFHYAGTPPTSSSTSGGYFSQRSESVVSMDSDFQSLFPNSANDFPDYPDEQIGVETNESDLVDTLYSQVELQAIPKVSSVSRAKTKDKDTPPQSPISIKSTSRKITIQAIPNEDNFIRVQQSGNQPHHVRMSKDKARSRLFYNFDRPIALGSPNPRTRSSWSPSYVGSPASPSTFRSPQGTISPAGGSFKQTSTSEGMYGKQALDKTSYASPSSCTPYVVYSGSPGSSPQLGYSASPASTPPRGFTTGKSTAFSQATNGRGNTVGNSSSAGQAKPTGGRDNGPALSGRSKKSNRGVSTKKQGGARSKAQQNNKAATEGVQTCSTSSDTEGSIPASYCAPQHAGKPASMMLAAPKSKTSASQSCLPTHGFSLSGASGTQASGSGSKSGVSNYSASWNSSVESNSTSSAQQVIVPCVYKVYGCTAHLSTTDIPHHEFSCPFQCIKCPSCKWYEPLLFFNEHVLAQHLQHIESSPRALFLIQLNQENVWQSFYQLSQPYIYVYLVKVMPSFIRGHVAFIRTPELPGNQHFVSLQVKSFGQIRTRLSCPVPMFLGENKHLSVRNQKTKFLLKRNPNTREPKFYEMFTEIILPKVTVNISLEERILVDSWNHRDPNQTTSTTKTQHSNKRKSNPENKAKPIVEHLIVKIRELKDKSNQLKNSDSSSGKATPDKYCSQSVPPLILKKSKPTPSDLTVRTSVESISINEKTNESETQGTTDTLCDMTVSSKYNDTDTSNTKGHTSGAKEGHMSKKSAAKKITSKQKKTLNVKENTSATPSNSKCTDSYSPSTQKLLHKLADALETVKSHLKAPDQTQTPESKMKLAQAFRTIQCNRSHVSYVQKTKYLLPVTSPKVPNPKRRIQTLSPGAQDRTPSSRPRGRPRKNQNTSVSSTCTQSSVVPTTPDSLTHTDTLALSLAFDSLTKSSRSTPHSPTLESCVTPPLSVTSHATSGSPIDRSNTKPDSLTLISKTASSMSLTSTTISLTHSFRSSIMSLTHCSNVLSNPSSPVDIPVSLTSSTSTLSLTFCDTLGHPSSIDTSLSLTNACSSVCLTPNATALALTGITRSTLVALTENSSSAPVCLTNTPIQSTSTTVNSLENSRSLGPLTTSTTSMSLTHISSATSGSLTNTYNLEPISFLHSSHCIPVLDIRTGLISNLSPYFPIPAGRPQILPQNPSTLKTLSSHPQSVVPFLRLPPRIPRNRFVEEPSSENHPLRIEPFDRTLEKSSPTQFALIPSSPQVLQNSFVEEDPPSEDQLPAEPSDMTEVKASSLKSPDKLGLTHHLKCIRIPKQSNEYGSYESSLDDLKMKFVPR
ncbi:hypothetical protein WDU94_013045, partial [Cyamophila willieti]